MCAYGAKSVVALHCVGDGGDASQGTDSSVTVCVIAIVPLFIIAFETTPPAEANDGSGEACATEPAAAAADALPGHVATRQVPQGLDKVRDTLVGSYLRRPTHSTHATSPHDAARSNRPTPPTTKYR